MRISRLNLVCIICAGLMCLVICACDNNSQTQEAEIKLPDISARAAQNQAATEPDAQAAIDAEEPENLEDFEVEEDKLYSGNNKTDPFLPLIKSDSAGPDEEDGDKKRVPQTPLERFDLGQLKLSAVVETSDGNSAVIVESSGRGYVVKVGAYVGLNGGQVTEIKNDRVIIEEPMGKNERGEIKVNVVELILPKPAGAF